MNSVPNTSKSRKHDGASRHAAPSEAEPRLDLLPLPEHPGADPADADQAGGNPADQPDGEGRPTILVTTQEHEVNAEAAQALAGQPEIYQRGGALVRVLRDSSPAGRGIRRPMAPRIEALPQALLREKLAASALWLTPRAGKDGGTETPARPPGWCVAAVHAHGEWPGVRHLESVVEYPVLRRDGSVLLQPGYDAETALLLEPMGELPGVPEYPSRDDVWDAVGQLLAVVADFPFGGPAHEAAWLAALLTPLARFAFRGPAPLFLAEANVRGTGKGLLMHAISCILTGDACTVASYSADVEEMRKRITSIVLAGDRLVLLDNIEGRLGDAALDSALTGHTWKDRLLGGNKMVEAPLKVVWLATANNPTLGADTARRILPIRLESPEERPEERQGFRHPDLLGWVGQHRLRLLGAALTVLRGYCVAGRPDMGLTAWGTYEDWSALVRGALVWAGLPDPAETRLALAAEADIAAESMAALLQCLRQLDPVGNGMTAAELVDVCRLQPNERPPTLMLDLRAAIEGLAGKLDSRALGYRLRNYRRRVFGGLFLDRARAEHKTARWAAYPAAAFSERRTSGEPAPSSFGGDWGDEGDGGDGLAPSDTDLASELPTETIL